MFNVTFALKTTLMMIHNFLRNIFSQTLPEVSERTLPYLTVTSYELASLTYHEYRVAMTQALLPAILSYILNGLDVIYSDHLS